MPHGSANITVNKNAVPNDPLLHLLPAVCILVHRHDNSRYQDEQAKDLAGWMCDVLDDINDERAISRVRNQMLELCANYPV